MTKEEKQAKKKANKEKRKGVWAEFKKFISKGNVLDMAVGVIMGSAFSAIVTAFTNILLCVCTWGVPGGIKGLVTVLPAANDAQKGMDVANGLGQFFEASELQNLATKEAVATYTQETVDANPNLIESVKSTILGKYTLHGTTYTYNLSSTIDWGTLINAVISFLIIAATLFTIVKIAQWSAKKRQALKEKAQEEYYQKHPEERPAPVEAAPAKPTTDELLTAILGELQKANTSKESK